MIVVAARQVLVVKLIELALRKVKIIIIYLTMILLI